MFLSPGFPKTRDVFSVSKSRSQDVLLKGLGLVSVSSRTESRSLGLISVSDVKVSFYRVKFSVYSVAKNFGQSSLCLLH